MKFYNREQEIAELRRIAHLSFTINSRMTVITGRRRIGKTSLIKHAFKDSSHPMLYFFIARKAESALMDDFVLEIKNKLSHLNIYIPNGLQKPIDVIRHLFELARNLRFTLVIDEFQEFLNINPSLFSDLQNMWDSYRGDTHLNLILSGSVHSMMKRIFTDAHEPLFGRADNIINLKPFKISVIKEILRDYNPAYTNDDLLTLYSIAGGVPKYIEVFCDNGYVNHESILRFTTSNMSPFIEEGRNLLITEFGRDYGTYFSILLAISQGRTSQSEISSALGNINIGGHLEKLENVYGIISKYRPIFAKPGSKNNVRFKISDIFLNFWFHFIESNRSMVELDNYNDLAALVEAEFPTYTGHTLEHYFRQKLAQEGGFREIGSWWLPKLGIEASEIDIVGIKTNNKEALLAEVKRNIANYSHKRFMEKVDRIKTSVLANYQIETRLFTMEDM
ncbi:MAG: AAA family ATPase [Muribaculaceae bacterium]|nr:AAA family ATPase [Muribaculaceae bacterium]